MNNNSNNSLCCSTTSTTTTTTSNIINFTDYYHSTTNSQTNHFDLTSVSSISPFNLTLNFNLTFNSTFNSTFNLTHNSTLNNAAKPNEIPTAVALIASQNFKFLNTLVGIIGFLLNSFVVVILLFGSKRSGQSSVGNHLSSSNFHVCCQSSVDSIVGLILFSTTLFEDDGLPHYSTWNLSHQILCRVWLSKCFLWTGYTCSTYCVLSLNFERYVAIVHPIFHKTKFSRNRIYSIVSLSIALLIGGGYNICYIPASSDILPDGRCTTYSVFPSEFARKFVGFLTFFFLFFIPLMVIIILYTRMILVLHKRVVPQHETDDADHDDAVIDTRATIANEKSTTAYVDSTSDNNNETVLSIATISQQNETIKQSNQKTQPKKQKKEKPKSSMERARDSVFKTSALLSFSFVACWSWNQIYYFMFQLGVPGCDLTGPFYDFTVFMIFVNCIAYPIIFISKYDPVKKNIQNVLHNIKNKLFNSKEK